MKNLIKKFYKKYIKFLDRNNYQNWLKDQGDEVLKFQYDLSKESLIFELGAYKGGMVREFEKRFNSYIYAFEPSKKFFKILKNSFKSRKIKILNLGLANKNHTKKLIFSNDGTYVSSLNNKKNNYELVKLVKLSQFIELNKIDFINLVNINIEGSEYGVLKDLISSNQIKKIDHLQIQFHRNILFYRLKRFLLSLKLKKTHKKIWCYDFIWERWDLKSKNIKTEKFEIK